MDPDGLMADKGNLNYLHFGARVHRLFEKDVADAKIESELFTNRWLSTGKENNWIPKIGADALRPDVVYGDKYVLELKPAGKEKAALKQAQGYVAASKDNLKLGNSEEFLMMAFGGIGIYFI